MSEIKWLQNWQECLWSNILQSATLHYILLLCAFFGEGPAPFFSVSYSLELGPAHCAFSVLRWLRSDFNVLLNAELGQGLFNAQGGQAGSSISIPTLPHDFAHNPQGLEQQGGKANEMQIE